ncbi:hypothetical protein TNCV_1537431 [Trichonephila clavipes]|nr:hypothetical protein TNCV_1537431 [Trichonephila clavipes]
MIQMKARQRKNGFLGKAIISVPLEKAKKPNLKNVPSLQWYDIGKTSESNGQLLAAFEILQEILESKERDGINSWFRCRKRLVGGYSPFNVMQVEEDTILDCITQSYSNKSASTLRNGHGSLVVKVTDSWLVGQEFEPSTAEDPP